MMQVLAWASTIALPDKGLCRNIVKELQCNRISGPPLG